MSKGLIVITGASSGIGLKTAETFSNNGHSLLLLSRNIKPSTLPNSMSIAVDVADLQALKHAITEAESQFGPTEAIVNCAGVMQLGDITTQSESEWRTMVDVNILGVLNGMQAVLPSMRERKTGTIFNVSSIAGIKPFPAHAAYVGTKFAVHGMSDNVREEVASDNVRVITIAPGAVETPLITHTTSDEIKDNYSAWKKDIGGALEPEAVANAIYYAYSQPQHVCLREIVLSATKQSA